MALLSNEVNLTPSFPLSMIWIYIPIMRGRVGEEGLMPLLDTLIKGETR